MSYGLSTIHIFSLTSFELQWKVILQYRFLTFRRKQFLNFSLHNHGQHSAKRNTKIVDLRYSIEENKGVHDEMSLR